MEMKKAISIIAGVGAGTFIFTLIVGYFLFNDNAEVRSLKEQVKALEDEKTQMAKNLEAKYKDRIKELEGKTASLEQELTATKKDLNSKWMKTNNDLTISKQNEQRLKDQLKAERTRLEAQVRKLEEAQIAGPDLPTLVDELNRMWPAYIGFSVRGMELRNSLANARVATPDIEKVQKAAQDVLDYVGAYEQNILALRQHVKMVRPELDKIGIDPALILRLFSENIDRIVKNLTQHVGDITARVTTKKGRVDASKGFADIPIKLEEGDLLFFEYEGTWQMSSDRGMGSAAGWDDIPNHMKHTADAPGGCLVFKVGVSDTVLPAFGRQPKIAPETGLLRVGINDKVLDDNVGYMDVTVSRVPGKELDAFEKFWADKMAPIVHWEPPAAE